MQEKEARRILVFIGTLVTRRENTAIEPEREKKVSSSRMNFGFEDRYSR